MTEETEVAEIVIDDMQRLNKAFIHNMLKEWDSLEGKLPVFPAFIIMNVNQAWEKYVRRN